jgi:hypothetical protein
VTPFDRMQELAEAWGPDDRRALFASAYGAMTANVVDTLGSGTFLDDDWVAGLLERFADYYFVAVEGYDRDPGESSAPWRVAFDACRDPSLHPLRPLMLGINAHINYDLAFTLRDVLANWPALDGDARRARRADHDAVNAVIRTTIDAVQDDVVAVVDRRMYVLDRMLGPLDEFVFASLIADWRSDTWDDAVALLEAPPTEIPGVERRIEARALAVADRVLRVGPG